MVYCLLLLLFTFLDDFARSSGEGMYTGCWIEDNWIWGGTHSGKFWIDNGWIGGPKNSGKYWIQDGYIWEPIDSGKFWIDDVHIYGPSKTPPWTR